MAVMLDEVAAQNIPENHNSSGMMIAAMASVVQVQAAVLLGHFFPSEFLLDAHFSGK
ncbi:hypothetical protein B7P43_G01861 [Cryptotermes secundus]|uniref:Uncharacterized protein n=1 Tax=Cryptotermes secundus TaxID=105785 RepID=A0A2J7QWH2_9NEOP|nr:hypothetical protein B7P43_G01861 [Cryptotermes secundus]